MHEINMYLHSLADARHLTCCMSFRTSPRETVEIVLSQAFFVPLLSAESGQKHTIEIANNFAWDKTKSDEGETFFEKSDM